MLIKPTPEYVAVRVPDFVADSRYRDGDRAVALVFDEWPQNDRIDKVLAKVVVLNSLYTTRIYATHTLAQHIVDLNIDRRLVSGDPTLVEAIANVMIGGKPRFVLSFASKYCSWHQPEQYQVFDSLVEELLWQYKKTFRFARFKRKELRTYCRFVEIVNALVVHFGLSGFSRKDLDKFLWLEGRALRGGSA